MLVDVFGTELDGKFMRRQTARGLLTAPLVGGTSMKTATGSVACKPAFFRIFCTLFTISRAVPISCDTQHVVAVVITLAANSLGIRAVLCNEHSHTAFSHCA